MREGTIFSNQAIGSGIYRIGQAEGRGILDAPQGETFRGGRGCIGTPIAPLEQRFDGFGRALAAADLDQQPRNVADHVVQEGIGRDVDVHEFATALDLQSIDPTDR